MDTREDLGGKRNKERSQVELNYIQSERVCDQLRRKYAVLDHEVKK